MVVRPWILLLLSRAVAGLPVPSPAQLRYQSTDFVALIHFNMGTFAHNGDPCCDKTNWNVQAPYAAGKTSDAGTFNPKQLNTTQWMESIAALGANIAVLTAKHGCGFALWPTEATLPDGSPYGYNVGMPGAAIQYDVLQRFVDSAKSAGVGYGFYYSIMKNFYLCHNFSGKNSCMEEVLPRQRNVSEQDYIRIARQQVTELWTKYGNLSRIWVDSGLGGLGSLMDELQPQAAGTPKNPIDWCGTESGHPSRDVGSSDVWSTGHGYFGQADADEWVPKFCDPQLFEEHIWFWEPNLHVRSLSEMIPIYHDIVGRGMVMELAFSIDREGLVQKSHASVYGQLGAWVRNCYGSPLAATSGPGMAFTLTLEAGSQFDRIQLQEDIVLGQRVRNYTLEQSEGSGWHPLVRGSAIGRKRIHLLSATQVSERTQLRLRIENATRLPQIRQFAAFSPCQEVQEASDTGLGTGPPQSPTKRG
ncbi:FUC1 [Symbiodinium sp. KB8]|nr:FUC1 [Symbiodinium sp. KB8]